MAVVPSEKTRIAEKGKENNVNTNSDSSDEEITSGINEKSLLRKIDLHILPAVSVLYLLSFLDRSNGMFNFWFRHH